MEGASRVSDRRRERVAGRLRRACLTGRIGFDTFESRLERTLTARTIDELRQITHDLQTPLDRLEARCRDLLRPADAPPLSLPVGIDEIVIGRSRSCDVVLGADSVSRRHAVIRRIGDRWRVTDLGSLNGTRVNGVEIEMGFVEPGDRLTLGGLTFTFHASAPTP